MPPLKVDPAVRDVDALSEPFRSDARKLQAQMGIGRPLPFVVIETRRSTNRQRQLQGLGRSRTSLGAHCYGLAIDVMIDVRHKFWVGVDGKPLKALDGGPAAWDTGHELDRDGVAYVARPECARAVRMLGAAAEALGMTWGGRNSGGWASPYAGNEFGWDPMHIQAGDWRALVKKYGLTAD